MQYRLVMNSRHVKLSKVYQAPALILCHCLKEKAFHHLLMPAMAVMTTRKRQFKMSLRNKANDRLLRTQSCQFCYLVKRKISGQRMNMFQKGALQKNFAMLH